MIEPALDYEQKFALIKNKYIEDLKEKYILFVNYKNTIFQCEIIQGGDVSEILNELYLHVHKLSGSSTMIGFSDVGRASNQVERILKNYFINTDNLEEQILHASFKILLEEIEKIIKPI
jgi:chemotaxis protein histidine kinase CheA